jgi:hypothetical protein
MKNMYFFPLKSVVCALKGLHLKKKKPSQLPPKYTMLLLKSEIFFLKKIFCFVFFIMLILKINFKKK